MDSTTKNTRMNPKSVSHTKNKILPSMFTNEMRRRVRMEISFLLEREPPLSVPSLLIPKSECILKNPTSSPVVLPDFRFLRTADLNSLSILGFCSDYPLSPPATPTDPQGRYIPCLPVIHEDSDEEEKDKVSYNRVVRFKDQNEIFYFDIEEVEKTKEEEISYPDPENNMKFRLRRYRK